MGHVSAASPYDGIHQRRLWGSPVCLWDISHLSTAQWYHKVSVFHRLRHRIHLQHISKPHKPHRQRLRKIHKRPPHRRCRRWTLYPHHPCNRGFHLVAPPARAEPKHTGHMGYGLCCNHPMGPSTTSRHARDRRRKPRRTVVRRRRSAQPEPDTCAAGGQHARPLRLPRQRHAHHAVRVPRRHRGLVHTGFVDDGLWICAGPQGRVAATRAADADIHGTASRRAGDHHPAPRCECRRARASAALRRWPRASAATGEVGAACGCPRVRWKWL